MPVASIRPGNDQKAAADAEEAREQADREAGADQHWHQLPRGRSRQADRWIAAARALLQHQRTDRNHEDAEQEQQVLAVELLGDTGAGKCADDAREREHDRARPSDVTARQCAIMLASALIATAIALVPIATCGEAMPTP